MVMLQLYQNMVFNMRVNKNALGSLGLYKIKRNSGITPQAVGRMVSNGVIKVNNMDDIEAMVTQEASQQSFTEEANIVNWSERITSVICLMT